MRAVVIAAILVCAAPAAAERDLCRSPGLAHGKMIDLDVQGADLHDVFRLLADTAGINLVVSDQVAGNVTVQLKHVSWEAAACAIAGLHHLELTIDHAVLMVRPAAIQGP